MSIKNMVFYPACAASCLILLPVLALAGSIALMGYALVTELRELVFGPSRDLPDQRTARETAHRLCANP